MDLVTSRIGLQYGTEWTLLLTEEVYNIGHNEPWLLTEEKYNLGFNGLGNNQNMTTI